MLDDLKKLCENTANIVPNWRSLSKNDLCNLYLDYEEKNPMLASAYFSAILYNYWSVIPIYYASTAACASPEDIYDLLVDAIVYALKHKKWKDPKSKLYGDPNGPDKVIHIAMKSLRLNYLTYSNRHKRAADINVNKNSLNSLEEDYGDIIYSNNDFYESPHYSEINDFIVEAFNKKDYFTAFLIDGIINGDTFKVEKDDQGTYTTFVSKKLVKHLKHIDDNYCMYFAHNFHLNFDQVKEGYSHISELSSTKMYTKIDRTLLNLRTSKIVAMC